MVFHDVMEWDGKLKLGSRGMRSDLPCVYESVGGCGSELPLYLSFVS